VQIVLGALVLVVNALVYAWVVYSGIERKPADGRARPPRRSHGPTLKPEGCTGLGVPRSLAPFCGGTLLAVRCGDRLEAQSRSSRLEE
jgi:hypothetical protein